MKEKKIKQLKKCLNLVSIGVDWERKEWIKQ